MIFLYLCESIHSPLNKRTRQIIVKPSLLLPPTICKKKKKKKKVLLCKRLHTVLALPQTIRRKIEFQLIKIDLKTIGRNTVCVTVLEMISLSWS